MENIILEPMPEIRKSANKEGSTFEAAIGACGFGLFNVLLLLASIPGICATVFELTTMSYVVPAAECDLELTLLDKGWLNAITYLGTIISAVPCGFLADKNGRKYIIVIGLLLLGVINLLSALSTNTMHLMAFKFVGGFVAGGPLAIFIAYITEFHGKKHRLSILTTIGLIKSLPFLLQPVVAYLILPLKINFQIFNFSFNSWKLFLTVAAAPALLSGFLLSHFPQSPKFLMATGNNEKALIVFKKIYALNMKKSPDTYPISTLIEETTQVKKVRQDYHQHFKNIINSFSNGFQHVKELCSKEHQVTILKLYLTHFLLEFSVIPMRLYLPQYFATSHEMESKSNYSLDTCSVIDYTLRKYSNVSTTANVNCESQIVPESYINNIIVAIPLFLTFVFATIIVQRVGNNFLLKAFMATACCSILAMYGSKTNTEAVIFSSIFAASSTVTSTFVLNIAICSFPTSVRAMVIITITSVGRLGSMLGNIILPVFMRMHCLALYGLFECTLFCSLMLSFLLNNPTKDNLK